MAQNPKPQTVAIVAADAEFSVNASEGARDNAKVAGLKVVYDKPYPPSTTDFAPIVRAIQATNPDIVVICSYPLESVGMVKAINEIGFKPKMIGGGLVGLQATAIKTQLGPLLNGFVNYRLLGAGSEDGFPGGGRLHQEVSGEGGLGGRRPARLLHRALGLCADGGPGAGNRRQPRPSTTTSLLTTSAPTRSRPWSAT